ncbi:MAG: T9SS type A sorting domain-containing protein [Saprospiraceae bacterium]
MLIAAGGGGGSGGSNVYPDAGGGGLATLSAVPAGGTSSGYAAGGGGFIWPGEDGFAGSTGGEPGTLNGGLGNGGLGGANAGGGGQGFGGGGGGAAQLGGGGGGYRGGDGGGRDEDDIASFWGKGGYSFISQSPALQPNPILSSISDGTDGNGMGKDGKVKIECVSALPVELVSFEGRQEPKGVLLEWVTSTEVNNRGFNVEHSGDGIIWQKVGFVAGNGTTSLTQQYHFLHEQAINGLNYYRLKQMDHDGVFEYSDVISVLMESTDRLRISPNPTSGQLTLTGPDMEGAMVDIRDQFGKTVKKTRVLRRSIDLSDLPAGVYLLNMQTGGRKFLKRIVKE